MYNFFDFYTKIPRNFAMSNFGFAHISCIILIFLLIFICLKYIKTRTPCSQKRVLYICAILVSLLELSHNLWLYVCGNATVSELLSLHLCGLQMYFIPLAVFTKHLVFKDFIFATSILGGIFGIVFPSGITDTYPLWHFQTLQTFAYHALLIFVPMLLISVTDYRPTIKRFYKVFVLFLVIVIIAFTVDIAFNQNYLFLLTAPDMPLLHNMQLELRNNSIFNFYIFHFAYFVNFNSFAF